MLKVVKSGVIVVALAGLAACSERVTDPMGGGPQSSVQVQDNLYTPASAQVAAGTTVTWTWSGANLHSVTFDDGPESDVQTRGTYQRRFAAPGQYRYHCVIHGLAMSGTVAVQ